MIRVPSSIKHYLDDEKSVPLIAHNGIMWYYITQKEKDTLKKFIAKIDSIPESEWRLWDDKKKWKYSTYGNLADRIVRNCKIRETNMVEGKN